MDDLGRTLYPQLGIMSDKSESNVIKYTSINIAGWFIIIIHVYEDGFNEQQQVECELIRRMLINIVMLMCNNNKT